MSQAFYPTNDGHVGNLKKMTTTQILELVRRQENLLKKKSFLNNLADKGAKIKGFLAQLQDELTLRQNNSPLGRIKGDNSNTLHTDPRKVSTPDDYSSVGVNSKQGHLPDNQKKTANGNRERKGVNSDEVEVFENLYDTFRGLTVEEKDSAANKPKHQYELALERAEENRLHSKPHLLLNKTLKVEHIQDLPEEILRTRLQSLPTQPLPQASKLKSGVMEESAATPPCYKYSSAQVIPVTEALDLQLAQKQKQEELQAKLAAEKLFQRLHIKMEPYSPEGVDMSYRKSQQDEIDSDDDIEGTEVDYANTISISDSED